MLDKRREVLAGAKNELQALMSAGDDNAMTRFHDALKKLVYHYSVINRDLCHFRSNAIPLCEPAATLL